MARRGARGMSGTDLAKVMAALGIGGAAVGAGALGYRAMQNDTSFGEELGNAYDGASDYVSNLFGHEPTMLDRIGGAYNDTAEYMGDMFGRDNKAAVKELFGGDESAYEKTMDYIDELFGGDAMDALNETSMGTLNRVTDSIGDAYDGVSDYIGNAYESMKGAAYNQDMMKYSGLSRSALGDELERRADDRYWDNFADNEGQEYLRRALIDVGGGSLLGAGAGGLYSYLNDQSILGGVGKGAAIGAGGGSAMLGLYAAINEYQKSKQRENILNIDPAQMFDGFKGAGYGQDMMLDYNGDSEYDVLVKEAAYEYEMIKQAINMAAIKNTLVTGGKAALGTVKKVGKRGAEIVKGSKGTSMVADLSKKFGVDLKTTSSEVLQKLYNTNPAFKKELLSAGKEGVKTLGARAAIGSAAAYGAYKAVT